MLSLASVQKQDFSHENYTQTSCKYAVEYDTLCYMSNSKQWHFFDKVLRRWVVLQVGDFESFQKEMEDSGYSDMGLIVDSNGMCVPLDHSTNTTGQNCYFVWLNGWKLATLVHEISHLVMYIFSELGIPISQENTEVFAHYTEYWFTEMTKAYRKYPEGLEPGKVRK